MVVSSPMTPYTGNEADAERYGTFLHDGSSRLGSGAITGELGEGGMAVVYEIWNEQLGVKRAVKVLRPQCSQENHDRFHTEMKLMAQLDHPNIVTIHTVGQWHGLPYIEMDRVDGESLHYLISRRGALPVDFTVAIALVVARALRYTHSFEYTINGRQQIGLLHRDLKPANILVSTKGKVQLTDFGIATPVNVSMHTPDGNVVGSLQYIAPEQLEGKEAGPTADMYSFGCVLYEMLTGFQMFPHTNISKLIAARSSNDYEPLSSLAPNLSPRLRRFVERCLRTDPRQRPESMREVCRELGKIYESLSGGSPEQVVARYMKQPRPAVDVPRVPRRTVPGRFKAVAVGALAATLAGALTLGAGTFIGRLNDSRGAALGQAGSSGDKQGAALIDSLRNHYGVRDLLTIMKEEDARGDGTTVIALSAKLSERKARSLLGVLLTTRALERTGNLSEEHFHEYHVNDAEFLLAKARWYYSQDNPNEALRALQAANQASAYLLDENVLRWQAKLYEARSLTALATKGVSTEAKERALACWRDIRFAYRKQTDNAAYKEAVRASYLLANL
ncbi:MAG: protein kinase [Chitinivibrionales bacterium]|nr:protein kinase [Chitinivibrionales bacterium]MBD3358815.1 protein kinase [Chitinivibrionales bacterium]